MHLALTGGLPNRTDLASFMAVQSRAWVRTQSCSPSLTEEVVSLIGTQVDLGGSFAVASRGLFATGVSTDLSGKALI